MTASRNHAGAAQPRRRLRAGGAGGSSLAPSPPENTKAEADSGPPVMATPDVATWADQARTGDMLVYATRPWLPVASPAAAFLRRLAEQGVVTLTQKRRHDLDGVVRLPRDADGAGILRAPATLRADQSEIGSAVGGGRGDQRAAARTQPVCAVQPAVSDRRAAGVPDRHAA